MRRHLHVVLDPLVHSIRGQLFLLNLSDALPFLDPPSLVTALQSIQAKDARRMHEADYLGHLKGILQRSSFGQLLRNPVASFDVFALDKWVVNILPYVSYKTHYEDPRAAISGHVPFDSAIGTRATAFKPGSSTAPFWWVASRLSFPNPVAVQNDAQACRDLLGLVHFDNVTPLVAMHMEIVTCAFFRPTVIEANPNARFRQIDPANPAEVRWGRTIDLEKLGTLPVGGDIGGVPELVAGKIALSDAKQVTFHYLGRPSSDRSTTSMDKKFLESMRRGRDVPTIEHEIIAALVP